MFVCFIARTCASRILIDQAVTCYDSGVSTPVDHCELPARDAVTAIVLEVAAEALVVRFES